MVLRILYSDEDELYQGGGSIALKGYGAKAGLGDSFEEAPGRCVKSGTDKEAAFCRLGDVTGGETGICVSRS